MTAVLDFLNRLERDEVALLGWGLVDGFFTDTELEQRAEDFLAARTPADPTFSSGWELVEALLETRLLWRLPNSERYRTRMGEAIRLFARLRQIFPDAQNVAWRSAANLVADYRLVVRPRSYPCRDLAPSEAIAIFRQSADLPPVGEAVIRGLVFAGTASERRLAGFQVRATARVMRGTDSDRALGTIVCAGTGSGKTLAFYLPAYAALATRLSSEHWTKCLAIYPRNELLKDQLREALTNARRIAPALAESGRRKFVIAALYGDVPRSATDITQGYQEAWLPTRINGVVAYVCPYVRCPSCGEPMAWRSDYLQQAVERLLCTSCSDAIEPDEIRLTRDRMLREPADILFSTTEMLNQRMSSGRFARLFGIGLRADRRPCYVLLDEVHAYEGIHGAHVALLLRRWRRASDARPHFVGLSATLADAPRFFADLVGIGPGDVSEVSPHDTEMQAEGAEYLLALRGDPSSGTSLLSTTIQGSMLLRRLLSPQAGASHGNRVFAFTDNLDVTNRLYHSLLDAEGWDARGNPLPDRPGGSLANIRAATLPNARERFDAGQNWVMVEDAGHVLAPGIRARVGRTSSQDAGVDPNAEIIVATSALEVGFDDPEIGAVIQHKAPQSSAAFLQRKGRAGRRREMRPWTVLALSDYGRDRTAYQAYDQVFAPTLPPRHLPLANRAVMRMQATYALMDWITRRLPPNHLRAADPWRDLSQPPQALNNAARSQELAARQQLYSESLRALLEQAATRDDFATFLERSLQLDVGTVDALLWEPPRAILTEAVPTLLRRLERNWRCAVGDGFERYVVRAPLPEFVPRTLFSDLQLPEVTVLLPPFRSIPARQEPMPLAQALREFAPGRVSRRFGVAHAADRHWIAPEVDDDDIPIDRICPLDAQQELGTFVYRGPTGLIDVPVVRPFALNVTVPPVDIQQSSNAFLAWHTQAVTTSDGHVADLPDGSRWGPVVSEIRYHTHQLGHPIELRRFAIGANASIGRGRGASVERRLRFVRFAPDDSCASVALGSVADVDAVQVLFHYPHSLPELCSANPRLARALRPLRFRDLVRAAAQLNGIANGFQRDWLAQAYLSSVTSEAVRAGSTLEAAEANLWSEGSSPTVGILGMILRWAQRTLGGDEEVDTQIDAPRRVRELTELLQRPDTLSVLHICARALWEPFDQAWDNWLRERFKTTLGAAFVLAASQLCPRMDSDAMLFEPNARPNLHSLGDSDEFWLTETTIGGAGFVEEFLARYAEDPRRFFRLLDTAVAPSDLEFVGTELERILTLATGESPQQGIIDAFAAIRDATSYEQSAAALATLRNELAQAGITPTPTLLITLNTRLLQPGTNAETDEFIARLTRDWTDAETRLGIDIDARVFAAVRSDHDQLELALNVAPFGDSDAARASWRYGVLYGMLWPRGAQVRAESLRITNPFVQLPEPDRLLVAAAVARAALLVPLTSATWFNDLAQLLLQHGAAELVADIGNATLLADALIRIACEPIDSEALLVHARLTGIVRDADQLRASIELPEAFQ